MVKKALIIGFELLLVFLAFQTKLDPWRLQIFLGLLFMSFLIAVLIFERLTTSAALLFLYLSFQALRFSFYPISPMKDAGMGAVTAMDALALGNFAFMLLLSMVVLLATPDLIATLFNGLRLMMLWDCIFVLAHALIGQPPSGLLANPAMDGCFIVMVMPFLMVKEVKWEVLVLPVLAVFATKSSTAICTLFLFAALSLRKKFRFIYLLPLLLGVLIFWQKFWDSSGRFSIWKNSMIFWNLKVNPLLGAGPSSFSLYGPHIQFMNGTRPDQLFIWLHNDWLQVLFEYGVIGLILLGIVFLEMLQAAKNKDARWIYMSIVLYGFVSFTQMPSRYFITALLGVFLLRISLESTVSKPKELSHN